MDLAELLELENDPAFAELACPTTGVLVWPSIRQEAFRLVIGDRVYRSAPIVDLEHRRSRRPIIDSAVRSVVHNLRHPIRRAEVLVTGTGSGLVPTGDGLFNRHLDYFAGALGERAWTLEGLFGDRWPAQKRTNRRLTFLGARRIERAVRVRSSVRPVHRERARDLIELVDRRGRERLGWELGDARKAALMNLAVRRIAAYEADAGWARRLFRKVRPRLAIVEEGCYGYMAVFNATARELGIAVAELQHGLVSRSHDAYNVAPLLATSEAYRQTQPTAFLSYGDWWNAQFNAPVDDRVVIGNPHRTEVLREWTPDTERQSVLVLGDGIETERYLAFAETLATLAPDRLRVRFRPHPVERARVRPGFSRSVTLDEEPDLYRSLASAHALIAEASTALFEAVGLVPRVFVWDTEKSRFYLGDHPFDRFTDAPGLAAALGDPAQGAVDDAMTARMWAESWQDRFAAFVELVSPRSAS